MLKYKDKFLITAGGCNHNEIKLWNLENGECKTTINDKNTFNIYLLIKGKFNELIVGACSTNSDCTCIMVYDIITGKCLCNIGGLIEEKEPNNIIKLKGNLIASGDGEEICIWNYKKVKLVKQYNINYKYLIKLNTTQMICDYKEKLLVFDYLKYNERYFIHSDNKTYVNYIGKLDHNQLIISYGDYTIKLFQTNTGHCIKTFTNILRLVGIHYIKRLSTNTIICCTCNGVQIIDIFNCILFIDRKLLDTFYKKCVGYSIKMH